LDEVHVAAIAVASLKSKLIEKDENETENVRNTETIIFNREQHNIVSSAKTKSANKRAEEDMGEESHNFKPPFEFIEVKTATLAPYPFFHYVDHSQGHDQDPLSPLTPPGRVPNFPAKMYAILSDPELVDVIAWMPHGRSWQVLKPRQFEIRVIPKFFEHSKFSSFIRQANGWGFRRITQGPDRNSYYHELFLRGLPYLCKKMKRPGVAEKVSIVSKHEPNFYKISEIHPLPERPCEDESIKYQVSTLRGPKERMPVNFGVFNASILFLNSSQETRTVNDSVSVKGAPTVITSPCIDVTTSVPSTSITNTVNGQQITFFQHHGRFPPLSHFSVATHEEPKLPCLNAYLSCNRFSEDNAKCVSGASFPMNNMRVTHLQNHSVKPKCFCDEYSYATTTAFKHLDTAASHIRCALNRTVSKGSTKFSYYANQA